MGSVASQITSLTIVYSTVYSDQRKLSSSASLAFVRGIHRGPVNSPHKWPATRKMFPFDDVIMTEIRCTSECDRMIRWLVAKNKRNSSALAMELRLLCIKPWKCDIHCVIGDKYCVIKGCAGIILRSKMSTLLATGEEYFLYRIWIRNRFRHYTVRSLLWKC